jgi:hypothetical protein
MSYAYHGNYCGPGWSAGAYRPSTISRVQAVDAFDDSCRAHDAAYAAGADLADADSAFFSENFRVTQPKRAFAALLVGGQGLLRRTGILSRGIRTTQTPDATDIESEIGIEQPHMTKNKRTAPQPKKGAPTKGATQPKTKQMSLRPSVRMDLAPVSIGNTVRASRPVTRSTTTGVVVACREFLAPVYETSNSNWQLAAAAPLHPAFYPASTMGQMARAYQYFTFRKCVIHFVTRQPTSVTGEIALCYSRMITEPAENGASATFLPRVMTRGDAIMGPLWVNHTIVVEPDSKRRLVDCFSNSDINEQIFGEIQAYTLSSVTDTAGYLLIDYELEFSVTMFAPHSTSIPIATGPGASYSLVDASTPSAGSSVALTNSSLTVLTNGTIIRAIVNADESSAGTGTTLANLWQTYIYYNSTSSTTGTVASSVVVTDGMIIWLSVVGSSLVAYSSYENAVSGDGSGQLFYRTTGTGLSTILVNAYVVRFGPAGLVATQ